MKARNRNATVLALFSVLIAVFRINASAQGNPSSKINLYRTFRPNYACRLNTRPIQFFSETELVLMSGPSKNCYRSVDQLELNLISIDGHILAHKRWPSTYPGAVMAPERLVLEIPNGLQVVNGDLAPVETVALPRYRGAPALFLEQEDAISVQFEGEDLIYGGTPLKLIHETEVTSSKAQAIFSFKDGSQLERDSGSLIEVRKGSATKIVGSLAWVIPTCTKFEYCQEYDSSVEFQVSTRKKKRILVSSNGSKIPVTDAAGLFPYFRLQVFDLDTEQELYREEDRFHTGVRSASLSPDESAGRV